MTHAHARARAPARTQSHVSHRTAHSTQLHAPSAGTRPRDRVIPHETTFAGHLQTCCRSRLSSARRARSSTSGTKPSSPQTDKPGSGAAVRHSSRVPPQGYRPGPARAAASAPPLTGDGSGHPRSEQRAACATGPATLDLVHGGPASSGTHEMDGCVPLARTHTHEQRSCHRAARQRVVAARRCSG